MKRGTVYLVGAGPGDPGLITVRGVQCLERADVVIYDNLCNPLLLRHAPQRAEILFAGKHSGLHTISQERIEQCMVRHARAGKNVVRLKGGDPFVFGRGGEEAATLQKAKISFEIVPGVTSAIAVPAYAGIPATHRDHASGVAIVTAYEDPEKPESFLDFQALARFPGTLMVLMSVKRLEPFVQRLMHVGKPPQTPVALVRWGTRGIQQALTGTLRDIAAKCEKTGFRAPAVVVIGDVVRCRKQLAWFEKRPLFGKRIVVTRSREQASALTSRLVDLGAEVFELPTIKIEPLRSRKMKSAAAQIWDWIVFVSPSAVDCFLQQVEERCGNLRGLMRTRFAVVGPGTHEKLRSYGLDAALMPKIHTAEELSRLILKKKSELAGQRILVPRSKIGGENVRRALKKAGAEVCDVVAYRNRIPNLKWEILALDRFGADIVTFTSSSTANHFVQLLKQPRLFSSALKRMLKCCRWISIGPATSAEIRRHGFRVHRQASTHDLDGLVRALKLD